MKQNEVTTKKIGDYTFYIRPFPAFTAANISGELTQLAAPIVGAVAPMFTSDDGKDGKGSVENFMDSDLDDALPAFSKAFASLSGDKFERLMKKLLVDSKNISVSGGTIEDTEWLDTNLANEIFCGEVQDMFILCFEVIKVNFSGFFKKISGRFGSLRDITTATKKTRKSGASST